MKRVFMSVVAGGLVLILGVGSATAGVVLKAVVDKHKSNPESLHNKIKHKKVMNGGGHLEKLKAHHQK